MRINYAKIAGPEVAVIRKQIFRSFRIVEVSHTDIDALCLNLTGNMLRVFGVDSDIQKIHGFSARAGYIFRRVLISEQRAGFGHPVTYEIGDVSFVKTLLYFGIEGGTSHNEILYLTSECFAQ